MPAPARGCWTKNGSRRNCARRSPAPMAPRTRASEFLVGGKMKKLILAGLLLVLAAPIEARERWSEAEANAWYARQKWPVGSNYIPADAINQLEMWQEASFNPAQIDKELGWAQGMGMDTKRVFLHDA